MVGGVGFITELEMGLASLELEVARVNCVSDFSGKGESMLLGDLEASLVLSF